MSACLFLASNVPMPEIFPPQEYPVHVDIDKGTIFDGNGDDNFSLRCFANVTDYTDKAYGVCLEWVYYTEGRANKLIDYIEEVLKETDCVEMWCVWLTNYYEYEDRPFIHNKSISIADLTEKHIQEIDCAEIWNKPDPYYPNRPSFYCLRIHQSWRLVRQKEPSQANIAVLFPDCKFSRSIVDGTVFWCYYM